MAARALDPNIGQGNPLVEALMQSAQAYGQFGQRGVLERGRLGFAQQRSAESRARRLERQQAEDIASQRRAAIWSAIFQSGGQAAQAYGSRARGGQ